MNFKHALLCACFHGDLSCNLKVCNTHTFFDFYFQSCYHTSYSTSCQCNS